MAKKSSNAPSGLSIARDGAKLTISWKIPKSKYDEGQQAQYRYKVSGKWGDWRSLTVGKTTTAKTISLDLSDYYPTTKKVLDGVQFRIRGRRENTSKQEYTWSDWSKKTFNVVIPKKPTASASLSNDYDNVSTFSWNVSTSTKNGQFFSRVAWQTILVKNCTQTDGSKLTWKSSTLGWGTGTGGASGSQTATEDTTLLADASYTRWYRFRSEGAQGTVDWKDATYVKHVYGAPYKAVIKKATANGYRLQITWESANTASHPIDSTVVQYKIGTPLANMACPSGSWTDAITVKDTGGADGVSFNVDQSLGDDECLWIRVNNVHDRTTTEGNATLVKTGVLASPSGLSVSSDSSTYMATVTATNNSSVPDSFLAVTCRLASNPNNTFVIGIIPNGSTSVSVQAPDWSDDAIVFGVYAAAGSYTSKTRSDGVSAYTVTAKMRSSGTVWDSGSVPVPPDEVTVAKTDTDGTVRVTWNWTWTDATAATVSWSDHADAWESTAEPSKHTVDSIHAAALNISNLETGKTWYVRVRLEDGDTLGAWSDIQSIDLSSEPVKPVLALSSAIIQSDGTFTAYWSYISTDSTAQEYAEICTATVSGSTITYGNIIAHTETAQHLDVAVPDDWSTGSTYLLCLRVKSVSGNESEWSDPVSIAVAELLDCVISSTSLTEVTLTADAEDELTRTVLALTDMPLTLTVTGAGEGGITTVIIERAEDFHCDRPDESVFNGYAGETIAIYSQTGEDQIEISNDDLIGKFDDGAQYRLIATVQDGLGQSDSAEIEFEVHWATQALVPKADVLMHGSVAKITPTAPTGSSATDTCDIYRLSADKPVLIVKDGSFGQTYVDPYPAINGSHRIVLKTANGDYTTADGSFAWIDLEDWFMADYAIIDFAGQQILLRYDLGISNKWNKDFKETRYLGGSVQGDWNQAVGRSLTMKSTSVTVHDDETIEAMRALAVYPGLCHIRTMDGSSFDADIQISEARSYQSGGRKVEFDLSITRVDPEGLDGLPLEIWEA